MCGRFALTYSKDEIEHYLNVSLSFDLPPRYNIAPTQNTLVICGQEKLPVMMHWGFLPFWARGKKIKEQINTKCETMAEKPMFRNAFKVHRCLVIASGFFEWQQKESNGRPFKTPYYITHQQDHPMIMAGIWDNCERGKGLVSGFSILTTVANAFIAPIHTRMPVILELDQIDTWLNLDAFSSELAPLFHPSSSFHAKRVSSHVNSPKNDDSECLS